MLRIPYDNVEAFWKLVGPPDQKLVDKYGRAPYFTTPRWGMVNLLVCLSATWYIAWRHGTEILKRQAPTTHDDAVAVFDLVFEKNGLQKRKQRTT